MKLRKFTLVSLAVLLAVPFFSSCKRGENDPFLSLLSRDSRISAVWTLSNGHYDYLLQENEEFRWTDDDCEDGIGMIPEYRETDTKTISYNFSNELARYEHGFETTRPEFMDGSMIVPGKQYEDAISIIRDINFKYELTIKKNGTYRCYITYNLFEDDYLHPFPSSNGKPQYGETFSGTFEYVDEWHWTDNSLGTKQGIQFDGFPFLNLTEENIGRQYDINGSFQINWINGITFSNQAIIMELDKLESKEMTLMASNYENGFYQELDEEYEVNIPGQGFMDCQGTFTYNSLMSQNYFLQFTSDGKSVDE